MCICYFLLVYTNYARGHLTRVQRVCSLRALAYVKFKITGLLLEIYLHVEPHFRAELQKLSVQLFDLVRYARVVSESYLNELVNVGIKNEVVLEHARSLGPQCRHLRVVQQVV